MELEEKIENYILKVLKEVAKSDSIVSTWEGKKYGIIQKITNPKKGDVGEKFIAEMFNLFDYPCEITGRERIRGGNNVDLLVDLSANNKKERVEVKLATLDVNGKYQFGWIPVNHDYTLIVFLGVNPDKMFLSIKTKGDIEDYIENPRKGKTLTPVPTPENPTHRKWTTSAENADMVEIDTYGDIKSILDLAITKYLSEINSELKPINNFCNVVKKKITRKNVAKMSEQLYVAENEQRNKDSDKDPL